MDYREFEPLLERHGWTITCHSPLEIEHPEDGSASGYAASMLIKFLLEEYMDGYEKLQDDIAKTISYFEEDFKNPVSCFLILHDSEIGENQLLELSKDSYQFVLSSAQILDPNPAPVITRMNIFKDDDDLLSDEEDN